MELMLAQQTELAIVEENSLGISIRVLIVLR